MVASPPISHKDPRAGFFPSATPHDRPPRLPYTPPRPRWIRSRANASKIGFFIARRSHQGRCPAEHPFGKTARSPRATERARGTRCPQGDHVEKPRAQVLHRSGLPRHAHPRRDPAQHSRKPRLVHRLHPLPSGNRTGPSRGLAQFPDDDHQPHRPRCRKCLAAR